MPSGGIACNRFGRESESQAKPRQLIRSGPDLLSPVEQVVRERHTVPSMAAATVSELDELGN